MVMRLHDTLGPLLAPLVAFAACGGAGAGAPAPAQTPSLAAAHPPAAPASAREPRPPAPPAARWDAAWKPVDTFRGARDVFSATTSLCATTAAGVRCLDASVGLGPLATTPITSPSAIWGFTFLCGVGDGGALVCNVPPADKATQGPPRLADLTSLGLHAASHRDGTLSVTTNRDAIGYASPGWAKVRAVHDAVQAASSWYATRSCYRERGGGVACVDHDVAATPQPVAGVKDAARIWKSDEALWVLTRDGRLLATRKLAGPVTQVATGVVQMTPDAAAPGSSPPPGDVPCAVDRAGQLLCGLDHSWKLVPVPGAGPARAVFGGSDWICAEDPVGVVRCIRHDD